MTFKSRAQPPCFGILDQVFPMAESGLRESPEKCLSCVHKTECLRTAAQGGGGREMEKERVDRAWESGNMGFFKRWSKKKSLARAADKEKPSEKRRG